MSTRTYIIPQLKHHEAPRLVCVDNASCSGGLPFQPLLGDDDSENKGMLPSTSKPCVLEACLQLDLEKCTSQQNDTYMSPRSVQVWMLFLTVTPHELDNVIFPTVLWRCPKLETVSQQTLNCCHRYFICCSVFVI